MLKRLIWAVLFVFSVVFGANAAESKHTLYYFYSNMRCTTCRNFERMTTDIAPSLPVQFKTINTDDKGNEHYMSDYGLYTKSVVIVDDKGNYKNLEKIWDYSRNEDKFKAYITDEVNTFIKANP